MVYIVCYIIGVMTFIVILNAVVTVYSLMDYTVNGKNILEVNVKVPINVINLGFPILIVFLLNFTIYWRICWCKNKTVIIIFELMSIFFGLYMFFPVPFCFAIENPIYKWNMYVLFWKLRLNFNYLIYFTVYEHW